MEEVRSSVNSASSISKGNKDDDLRFVPIDMPMGGRRFTRIDKSCSKMAKLDRFLVSNGLAESLSQMVGMMLPILWSDHCPIFLKHEVRDYGLIPFKLFNSWSMHEGYEQVIRDAWNTTQEERNAFINFKSKLKHVKMKLKELHKNIW
ncbi:RNA-directed DNA polymerase, eukaryota [Tanacetum coccineum]